MSTSRFSSSAVKALFSSDDSGRTNRVSVEDNLYFSSPKLPSLFALNDSSSPGNKVTSVFVSSPACVTLYTSRDVKPARLNSFANVSPLRTLYVCHEDSSSPENTLVDGAI